MAGRISIRVKSTLAEMGSANGITNARGLAGMYAPLANGGEGLVSSETIARMGRVSAATHEDATLMQPMRFGLGYMVSTDNRAVGGDSLLIGDGAFGHVGMGRKPGLCRSARGAEFWLYDEQDGGRNITQCQGGRAWSMRLMKP